MIAIAEKIENDDVYRHFIQFIVVNSHKSNVL
jgi:hypothetical protein